MKSSVERSGSPNRPRDAIELIVHEAFCTVLADRAIDLTTPFLDLGGHSLAALMLQDQLYEATGREVSLEHLFVSGSVESIAAELRTAPATGGRRSLCTLAPPADRLLHCVHSVVGTAVRYRELANLLARSGMQVLAYQAPGLVPGSDPATSIEEMARLYVNELMSSQQDEVELLGYSMGATVVYEMARLLLHEGVKIRHLYLVDTTAPGSLDGADDRAPVLHLANSLDGDWDTTALEGLPDDEAYARLFAHLQDASKIPPAYEIADLEHLGAVVTAHARALSRYRPELQALSVSMTVFSASYGQAHPADLGWGALATAPPRVVHLDAPHHLLFAEPDVRSIANVVVETRHG
jgi:thioesterase domain-containing protein